MTPQAGERATTDDGGWRAGHWLQGRTDPLAKPPAHCEGQRIKPARGGPLRRRCGCHAAAHMQASGARDKATATRFHARPGPMIAGPRAHPASPGRNYARPPGMLAGGCLKQPSAFADHSEPIQGTACPLTALPCLETGRVPA